MPDSREKTGNAKKANATSFQSGRSGNPGGRPRLQPEYRETIEELAKLGLDVLREVLNDRRHPRREQAAEYVCNRAWGTPTARTEVTGGDGKPLEVEFPALLSSLRRLNGEPEAEPEAEPPKGG